MSEQNIQDVVRHKYGEAAKQAATGGAASCGGGGELSCCDPITRDLYDETQIAGLPEKAVAASLGCGNPTALAQLQAGETSWILAQREALMFCFRRSAWVRPEKPMAWT